MRGLRDLVAIVAVTAFAASCGSSTSSTAPSLAPATATSAPSQAPATATSAPSQAPATATSAPSEAASTPAEPSPTVAESVVAVGGGGHGTVVTPFVPDTLNVGPMGTWSSHMTMGRNIFETLVDRDAKTNALIPGLALTWTQTEPTKWQFELRQGVTFHDGTDFNAESAAAALNVLYDAKTEGIGDFVGSAATFQAAGPYTLEMTTEAPDPIVPSRMFMVPIASAKQIAEDPDGMKDHPIGTGPYEFVSWNKGQSVELKLYPQSWRAKAGMFDTVSWLWRPEAAVRAQMIQTGEADATNYLTPDQCSGGDVQCVIQPTVETYWLRLDQYNQTVLGDVRVRQAIAMALDRGSIAKNLLGGAPVYNTVCPEGSTGWDPNLVGYQFDLKAAKDLIAAAAADGVPVTKPVTVSYFIGSDTMAQLGTVVEQSLKDLGLNVTLKPYPDADYGKIFTWDGGLSLKKDLPADANRAILMSTGCETFDVGDIERIFAGCDGRVSVFCDPAIDKESAAAVTVGGDERNTTLAAIWKEQYAKVAMLPFAPLTNFYAFSDRLKVPTRTEGTIPLWDIGSN